MTLDVRLQEKILRSIHKTLLSTGVAFLSLAFFISNNANASESTAIKLTTKAPLFDGSCREDEWQSATKIKLPAQAAIYLMHDKGSLYVCAKGKAEDYAVIDIYIEHAETGLLHNLHASAQLGEKLLKGTEWEQSDYWNLNGWGGFWVPYAGNHDTEDGGRRPKFLKGSDREIQILRNKFSGNIWKMMIGVSAIYQEGEAKTFFYPEKAIDTDSSTWTMFSFSEYKEVKK